VGGELADVVVNFIGQPIGPDAKPSLAVIRCPFQVVAAIILRGVKFARRLGSEILSGPRRDELKFPIAPAICGPVFASRVSGVAAAPLRGGWGWSRRALPAAKLLSTLPRATASKRGGPR
jgi:hypothetical protein